MYTNFTMQTSYVESNHDYSAEVDLWCKNFNNLMKAEKYAAIAVVAYYLPHQCTMVGCPLGDPEYKKIGESMRDNPAMFAAAERTGLFAEGIDAFCYAALDNAGSWAYYAADIEYLLNSDGLRKYISFSDRYLAESLLSGGDMLRDNENEALWCSYACAVSKRLDERSTRGYTC